jgi:hypothetical protein
MIRTNYQYEVLLNEYPIKYFDLPLKLNEEQLKIICQLEIKVLPHQAWAEVLLNENFIFKFPILNPEELNKYEIKVKFLQ